MLRSGGLQGSHKSLRPIRRHSKLTPDSLELKLKDCVVLLVIVWAGP
jgi:hypothetical protein